MSNGSDKERMYEVRVQGTLDESWFEVPRRVRM
jgi:hypothetical protein